MKALIGNQVGGEITNGDFDVGYLQGSNAIIMRNVEDIRKLWSTLQKGSNMVVWCDGLAMQQSKAARKWQSLDSDSDDECPAKKTKKEERDSVVRKCIEDMKAEHKDKYTPMQYSTVAYPGWGGSGCLSTPISQTDRLEPALKCA